jgi:hypothetical protein
MKRALPLLLGFGVALAFIIGQRMSTDAMAVVIGVAVGVAASVPTSLLLVALLRRERTASRRYDEPPPPPAYPAFQQPTIVILDPAQWANQRNPQPQLPMPPLDIRPDAGMRRLRIVGNETDWEDVN